MTDELILQARVVTTGEIEDGVDHVGWAAGETEGPHLIVMRDWNSSDGYCLVTHDGTYYGGVEAVSVGPGETELSLTAEAAEALGTKPSIRIRYEPGMVEADRLRESLTRLLG